MYISRCILVINDVLFSTREVVFDPWIGKTPDTIGIQFVEKYVMVYDSFRTLIIKNINTTLEERLFLNTVNFTSSHLDTCLEWYKMKLVLYKVKETRPHLLNLRLHDTLSFSDSFSITGRHTLHTIVYILSKIKRKMLIHGVSKKIKRKLIIKNVLS